MKRMFHLLGPGVFAASLLAAGAIAGCALHVGIYDEEHRDYHRWDDREDRAYREYLAERHEEYREFSKRSHDEQRDYWNWRHNHPDAGNH